MNILEHAKNELKLAGYNLDAKEKIESGKDYADNIAKAVLELLTVFANQHHSGMSANYVLRLFNQLATFKALTDLTDNPDEWEKVEGSIADTWQSKRQSSCFSHDMKTYYDVDDPDNNIFEVGEDGKPTGYATLKPKNERKLVKMVKYEVK